MLLSFEYFVDFFERSSLGFDPGEDLLYFNLMSKTSRKRTPLTMMKKMSTSQLALTKYIFQPMLASPIGIK